MQAERTSMDCVVRKARKVWSCDGSGAAAPQHAPRCSRTIERGESYVEYRGEAAAYQSGSRHSLDCAVYFDYWLPGSPEEAQRLGMDMAGRFDDDREQERR